MSYGTKCFENKRGEDEVRKQTRPGNDFKPNGGKSQRGARNDGGEKGKKHRRKKSLQNKKKKKNTKLKPTEKQWSFCLGVIAPKNFYHLAMNFLDNST